MGKRQRNIHAIERYVTLLQPILERATAGRINLEQVRKPESDPPMNQKALDLIKHPDNADATSTLEPIFHEMILSDTCSREYILWLVLAIAGARHGDPSAVKQWQAGETEQDQLFAVLFEQALSYVADELERKYPGKEICVTLNPKDEPMASKKAAAYHDRKLDTNDALRRLHRDWCYLRYIEGWSSEEARKQVAYDHDVSPKKVERAITECNRELVTRTALATPDVEIFREGA